MRLEHLSLKDFRSYAEAELDLAGGVTSFVGANGQGKTNLVEAVRYLGTHSSHRVSSDAPLVRDGANRAVVRGRVARGGRVVSLELEINPGRSNRARLGGAPVSRARETLGILAVVVFAPEDLALVKGDPGERRRFLDELLVTRSPRMAGVRSDYERVLKQRNALLKTAGTARRRGAGLGTLDVWDAHLARAGAALVAARVGLVETLQPHVASAYARLSSEARAEADRRAEVRYVCSAMTDDGSAGNGERPVAWTDSPRSAATWESLLQAALTAARGQELDRGVTLVGPHRDEMAVSLAGRPARGYASHGESWSLALALRLASWDVLAADGEDPVLILDDVFAELDARRRSRLAEIVAKSDQVLVTAAVADDVPAPLGGVRFDVADGQVTRVG